MTVSIDPSTHDFPTSRLRTRAEAEAYVASVCFKHGPPRLLGIELEWTVHHADNPGKPLDVEVLTEALGVHAPPSLAPQSPHRPLPNGSVLTIEPGGQVEISSPPLRSLCSLFDAVDADATYVREMLATAGLMLGEQGIDPWRHPRRVLQVPRYAAMEAAFDRIGLNGRLMMCSTAGIQVCLDMGESHRVALRWAALHALGPVMMATFANSPTLFARRTGWASTRTRALLRTDPPRTRPGPITADPAAGWAKRLLDTALMCLRRDGDDWSAPSGISFAEWIQGALPAPPTLEDLDYHLTTVFPPVRPRGYFEVRYLDAQAGRDWMLPAAALIALLREESTVDEVLRLTSPTTGRWIHAARHGLADPELARSARAVFALASRCLDKHSDAPEGMAEWLDTAVEQRLRAAQHRQR
ncbi:glutamate--cysteine ligase [Halopolyspora algeriensis]|uniref:Glutamate--cysteine ligase EgtA n=1 Tax=Halopolyspora algeriensis TaxID=1500506 RepID=A0A368VVW6_9ACTN|nr:ergothioneine biosynthesis glutamate--cysteine ligase EgtA [Halopolyspora algeriensis]RCW45983.1 glutamate--cysteine ligase [Halopolyspora algeriensis]TQM55396.1 glutamate--cysteine ligase [Halopolyspora algeriensis]